jgi:hypothetical protein
MLDEKYLLDDRGVMDFIIDGYLTVQTELSVDFHQQVYQQTDQLFETEGNPGNDILPKVAGLQEIFDQPVVRGALTSILGPGYIMHPHRHCHPNVPGSSGQDFHQDSYEDDQNVRHHRTRWVMAFYYPQDVSENMGPTAILPGSQYYYTQEQAHTQTELPLCGVAGTVTIVHYDLWHRATSNLSDKKRYMQKFLFCRMEEPQSPSWNSGESTEELKRDKHPGMWKHIRDWLAGDLAANGANGFNEGDLPTWISALQGESETARLDAAYALGKMGAAAVPGLVEVLRQEAEAFLKNNLDKSHTNPSQLYSVYALSAIGAPAVPALIETLRDKNWWVRAAASDILGDIGLPAQAAVPALLAALRDESAWVRRNATEALGIIGPAAQAAVPALIALLTDEHSWVRHNAVSTLARIGPAAQAAVPALRRVLNDETGYVRSNAAIALEKIEA